MTADDPKKGDRPSGMDEAAELLPWYVNGTLNDHERSRVEAYLEKHPEARDEVEFLRRLTSLSGEHQPEPPGEFGLKRLQRSLHRQRRADRSGISEWWRSIAIAAGLLLAIESTLLILPDNAGELKPAGSVQTADIQVMFSAGASEESIRLLLQEAGAEIVAGPGKLGVYHLALDDSADTEEVLAKLRSRKRVVTHASRF